MPSQANNRVLIVSYPPFERGGVPAMQRWLCSALKDSGRYHPTLLCTTRSLPADLSWEEGAPIDGCADTRTFVLRDVPTIVHRFVPRSLQSEARQLSNVFRKLHQGYRLHHVACGANWMGLGPARARIPFVLWVATTLDSELSAKALGIRTLKQILRHAVYGFQRRALLRMEGEIFGKASSIFGISPFTVKSICGLYPSVAPRCRWLPVPVNAQAVDLQDVHPEPGRVIFAGRVGDTRKDLATLLRAIAVAAPRIPSLKLVVMGGDMPPALDRLARSLGVRERLEVLGHVAQAREEYRRGDAMVISSIQEGLNIAGLEAFAHGMPVISTRCGGPECYVADGETGALVPVQDPHSLADSMVRILTDRNMRDRLGRNGRAVVLHDFSPIAVLRAFELEYDRLLETSISGGGYQ